MSRQVQAECLLSTVHRRNLRASSDCCSFQSFLLPPGSAGRWAGGCPAARPQRILHVAVQCAAHRAPAAGSGVLHRLWTRPRDLPAAGDVPGLFSARHPGGPLSSDRHPVARGRADLPPVLPVAAGALWPLWGVAGACSPAAGWRCAAGRAVRGLRRRAGADQAIPRADARLVDRDPLAVAASGVADADSAGLPAVSAGLRGVAGAVHTSSAPRACGSVHRLDRPLADVAAGLQPTRCTERAQQPDDADSGGGHRSGGLPDGLP